jgi:hypothetical protein
VTTVQAQIPSRAINYIMRNISCCWACGAGCRLTYHEVAGTARITNGNSSLKDDGIRYSKVRTLKAINKRSRSTDTIMSQCPRIKLEGSQVEEARSVCRSNAPDYLESIFMKLWAFTIILPRPSIHHKCVRLISVPIQALILL